MNKEIFRYTVEHALQGYQVTPEQSEIILKKAQDLESKHLDLKSGKPLDLDAKETFYLGLALGKVSSYRDPLTSAYRREIVKTITEYIMPKWINDPEFAGVTLVYIDLDEFGKINKNYGQHNGDLALANISQKILSQIRKEDIFIRMGGDEFLVILPQQIKKDRGDKRGNLKDIDHLESLHQAFTAKISSSIDIVYDKNPVKIEISGTSGFSYLPKEDFAKFKDYSDAFDHMTESAGKELLENKPKGHRLQLRNFFRDKFSQTS